MTARMLTLLICNTYTNSFYIVHDFLEEISKSWSKWNIPQAFIFNNIHTYIYHFLYTDLRNQDSIRRQCTKNLWLQKWQLFAYFLRCYQYGYSFPGMVWRKYIFMMTEMKWKGDISIGLFENYLLRQGVDKETYIASLKHETGCRHKQYKNPLRCQ